MKILKNNQKRRDTKLRARIHIEYRKRYERQIAELQIKHETEIKDQHKFFSKQLGKVRDLEKKQWITILAKRDDIIKNLQTQINDKKELFQYLKNREQELENITNIIGTKYKAFAELVDSGYGGIQQVFGHLQSYNKKHLKNDNKIIDAINE